MIFWAAGRVKILRIYLAMSEEAVVAYVQQFLFVKTGFIKFSYKVFYNSSPDENYDKTFREGNE
jgi:hypothetical protein